MKDKSELAMKIGAEVRRRRRDERRRSQEDFADDCGIARAYMGVIERGETNVTVDTAKRIVAKLGITLGEFFTGIGE